MTDLTDIIKFLAEHLWLAISGGFAWFINRYVRQTDGALKMLQEKIETQEKDAADYKLHVAENYSSKGDTEKVMQEILYVRKGVDDIKKILIDRSR